jgi:hypothetical protein
MKSTGLLLSAFSLLVVLLALSPFVQLLLDIRGGAVLDYSWRLAGVSGEGLAVDLSFTYRGSVPLTGVGLRVEALCGGAVCSTAGRSLGRLVRGESVDLRLIVPLNASSIRVCFESRVAGIYPLSASAEVSWHGLPG